ncbi:MAG: molybdopterin-guanine dinucleotide biosynthesis protein B [Acidobacteria bacterium]|nr:MAG: molybdopterin-guanine dinucleotide biosynthesis protein B [Acidobacteriota bacterium]
MPFRLLVVGASGSGKTTLVEKLIPALAARGMRVASAKHAHHGFEAEKPGSDSDRHAAAGATPVILVSESEAAVMWRRDPPRVEDLIDLVAKEVDIVVIEGYGALPGPKVLVHRAVVEPKPVKDPERIIAAVTDEPLGYEMEFAHDEVDALADLIAGQVGGK